MRKERKEFKRVEYKDVFIADDGTEFSSEDECRKYEGTCECAINAMFKEVPQQETYMDCAEPFQMFGCGDTMYAVKIRSLEDVEVVNKWIKYMDKNNTGIGADTVGTIQLLNRYDSYVYVHGTPDDLKKVYAEGIDNLVEKLVEKSEEGENHD